MVRCNTKEMDEEREAQLMTVLLRSAPRIKYGCRTIVSC